LQVLKTQILCVHKKKDTNIANFMPHILDVGTKKSTSQKLAQPIYG